MIENEYDEFDLCSEAWEKAEFSPQNMEMFDLFREGWRAGWLAALGVTGNAVDD